MRAAEICLIEAEARARQGQNAAAQALKLTLARNRNDAYSQSTSTGQALINEIMFQRRIEIGGCSLLLILREKTHLRNENERWQQSNALLSSAHDRVETILMDHSMPRAAFVQQAMNACRTICLIENHEWKCN